MFLAGDGSESDESFEIHGRTEGVRYQAGQGRHSGGRDLSEGRDQPDGLLQLEKEVCRPDAVGDAAPARAGAGEWAAEEDRGRLFVGQRDAAGRDQAKDLRPGDRKSTSLNTSH